ncbi:replication initiator protein A [Roseomonas sp. 18066]|uniref:replication initiator protein A n=1 Tax=Roseomonas sp. 18066 TaxID=2681412 RepID=UPI00135C156D|nr:replication initiator protein A [Roseomonas sp. 18066]
MARPISARTKAAKASENRPDPAPPDQGPGGAGTAAPAAARRPRETTPDLFDSPLRGKLRGQRGIMAYPFFHLGKTAPSRELLRYDDGQVRIEVAPGPAGMATIYDKDLILYIASLMAERMRRGELRPDDARPDREFTFTAHDFFRVAGRDTAGKAYDRLLQMLQRLQGTQVRTNIEMGGEGTDGVFSWIDAVNTRYRRNARAEKELVSVSVTLCAWLYRGILSDTRLLTFAEGYFDLAPLERRLYEIAKAEDVDEAGWSIGIEDLHARVGTRGLLRHFGQFLTELERSQRLLEFEIGLHRPPAETQRRGRPGYEGTVVTLRARPAGARPPALPAPPARAGDPAEGDTPGKS